MVRAEDDMTDYLSGGMIEKLVWHNVANRILQTGIIRFPFNYSWNEFRNQMSESVWNQILEQVRKGVESSTDALEHPVRRFLEHLVGLSLR